MSLITIFIILLVAVFATVTYVIEPSEVDKKTNERLAAFHRQDTEQFDEGIVKEQVSFSRIALIDRYLRNNKLALKLELTLEQAKSPLTFGRFFFYSAVLMIVGGLIGKLSMPIGLVGWIPGMLLGTLPLLWILRRRSGRLRKLNEQLPEAVDLMSRGLRTGYSLPAAFVMVADEVDDPLGPEFRRTADELNYGLPFREALLGLAYRFPIPDMQLLVTSILLQKETGGNLVELLDKISAMLRARIRLQQKVRVFTAQGRATGAILVAMPFVMFAALNLVHRGYTDPLFQSDTGKKLVYGGLSAITLGYLSIRRIVRIEV